MNAIFLLLTTAVSAGADPAYVQPVQCCAPAPAPTGCCGAVCDTCCEPVCDTCCAPKHKPRRSKHHKSNDCAPACCDTCAPAPAPTCGHVASCCDTCCEPTCCPPKKPSFFSRFRRHKKDCCAPPCDTCYDTCDSYGAPAAPGCTNCAPVVPGVPHAPGPLNPGLTPHLQHGAPITIPGAGVPGTPPVNEKGAEPIKKMPKDDDKGGKGAMLQSPPILTPTTAKVETEAKNPF